MKKCIFGAVILAACGICAKAADAPASLPPKGTICYSYNIGLEKDQTVIGCRGLGKFSSIAELYEKGYRVVNSGFVPGGTGQTMYFIIEDRKSP